MSVVRQLPRDILHSIYSEWLRWKDLSRIDKAFVEKNTRKDWLTSLTDLRLSKLDVYIADKNMRMFIKWLVSRKVFCVEDFPVGVDAIEDLMAVLDMESYCPALHSVSIERWGYNGSISDITRVKKNLSIFLSHCLNLQGVTVRMHKIDGYRNNLTEVVLGVLVEKLRENSLVKISVQTIDTNGNHEINVMITNLLIKHASSLRHLNVSNLDEEGMDIIVSTLIENQICLRELSIYMGGNPMQMTSSLISYISSLGGLLEVLEVFSKQNPLYAEDLVVSAAASCPKLTRLVTVHGEQCSMETLRQLYEQCPHLESVSIGVFNKVIETDEKKTTVSIRVIDSSDDWAICLSYALRRGQYKKVTLKLLEDCYHPVRNLKSMLEPYEIHLRCLTHELPLISLLEDLPHVNSLHLVPNVNSQYTDATLAAISEHANSLTELKFDNMRFSDKQLSELIKASRLLKVLTIDAIGWESLVTISKLSNLKMVNLSVAESVSEELLDGLFLSEKVKWSSTLEAGFIKVNEEVFCYKFNNRSNGWSKDTFRFRPLLL
eukprot:scaffold9318_cov183-Ochromonas_danica.AAC.4